MSCLTREKNVDATEIGKEEGDSGHSMQFYTRPIKVHFGSFFLSMFHFILTSRKRLCPDFSASIENGFPAQKRRLNGCGRGNADLINLHAC